MGDDFQFGRVSTEIRHMSSRFDKVNIKQVSIESAIEEKIRQAIERGEFDDLKGKGKPLDLTAYFNTPEDLRMAHAMLKSNEFVPEEVEMLREIAELKEQIKSCSDSEQKTALTKKLNDRQLAFTVAIEKYKRKK